MYDKNWKVAKQSKRITWIVIESKGVYSALKKKPHFWKENFKMHSKWRMFFMPSPEYETPNSTVCTIRPFSIGLIWLVTAALMKRASLFAINWLMYNNVFNIASNFGGFVYILIQFYLKHPPQLTLPVSWYLILI